MQGKPVRSRLYTIDNVKPADLPAVQRPISMGYRGYYYIAARKNRTPPGRGLRKGGPLGTRLAYLPTVASAVGWATISTSSARCGNQTVISPLPRLAQA
jgi:hypothetical protein